MVVDFHTHFGPGSDETDFLRAMDKHAIDMAVVSPILRTAEEHVGEINGAVHDLVQRHPDRFVGFASVIADLERAPELLRKYVEDWDFRGIKIHPAIQNIFPSDPRLAPLVHTAIELDIPILFHTGGMMRPSARLRACDPLEIDELALAFPEAKIVMAHADPLGWYPYIAAKHANVYMDTVMPFPDWIELIPGVGEKMLEHMSFGYGYYRDSVTGRPILSPDEYGDIGYRRELGSRKLIYGSDGGGSQSDFWFSIHLKAARSLDISEKARANILGENAATLLKLRRH